MGRIGRSIPIPENETEQIIPFQSFAVSVREVDPGKFRGQAFSVSLGGTITRDSRISEDSLSFGNQSTMTTASIKLPEDLFEQIASSWNQSRIRIVHTVFLHESLFVQRTDDEFKVGSIIISASISGMDEVEGISDPPILISFVKNRVSTTTIFVSPNCTVHLVN